MSQPASPSDPWDCRYQELRHAWFEQRIGWGQTLFMNRGMAAWMNAWPAEADVANDSIALDLRADATLALESGLKREVTLALVQMLLHHELELTA